ncbi:MAG: PIG-L family deacetylase [Bdellovibrionales bacterium]
MYGRRILILVPHPDDEVVGCCAAIGRARSRGAEIFAFYLTHGCVARSVMWPWMKWRYGRAVMRRRVEAQRVSVQLGIMPVGWSERPARHIWREMRQTYAEIREAATKNAIDQIWVPAYEGGNADHDATNALAARLRLESSSAMTVLEFAEYNYAGAKAHSQTFPELSGREQALILTPEERAFKAKMLAEYESEQDNLNYVELERETCRSLAHYDYNAPAHDGTQWYARFHWVPFRHPRVDFTQPQEVCAAIAAFMKEKV